MLNMDAYRERRHVVGGTTEGITQRRSHSCFKSYLKGPAKRPKFYELHCIFAPAGHLGPCPCLTPLEIAPKKIPSLGLQIRLPEDSTFVFGLSQRMPFKHDDTNTLI